MEGGRLAIVSSERAGNGPAKPPAVYVIDPAAGSSERIAGAGEHGIGDAAASPDGKRMVLSGSKFLIPPEQVIMPDGRTAAQRGIKSVGGDSGLWLLDLATAQSAPFAQQDGTSDLWPQFSPDGRSVLFTRMTETSPMGEPPAKRNLAVADLQTQQVTLLTSDGVSHSGAWSPDGKRIGFIRDAEDLELWLMNADGKDARAIKSGPIAEPNPVSGLRWRPDGMYVAYESSGQLSAVPTEGVGLIGLADGVTITQRLGFDISPDGKQLAYGALEGGKAVIRVVALQWPDQKAAEGQ